MKNIILTEVEVKRLYDEILSHPELLPELDDYSISKLASYVDRKRLSIAQEIKELENTVKKHEAKYISYEDAKCGLLYSELEEVYTVYGKLSTLENNNKRMKEGFSGIGRLISRFVPSRALENLNNFLGDLTIYPFIPNYSDVVLYELPWLVPDFKENLEEYYEAEFDYFQVKLKRDLKKLVYNDQNRVAYLKRTCRELNIKPVEKSLYLSITESITYFNSSDFRSLEATIDKELWDKLNEIGYALDLCNKYRQAVEAAIEDEFIIEGISNDFPHKQPRAKEDQEVDPKITNSRELEYTESQAFLDSSIDQIIVKHRENLKFLFTDKSANILYAPFQIVWQGSPEEKEEIEKRLIQVLINTLNGAWDVSERWTKEFRQEAIQQPHDIGNIFEKYFNHYRGLVERYNPFKYWALEYWPEPVKPDSSHILKGLWGDIFLLCSDKNLEFGVAFEIVERVFSANLTVAKLSRERVSQLAHENEVDNLVSSVNDKTKIEGRINNRRFPTEFTDDFLALFDNKDDAFSCLSLMRKFTLIGADWKNCIGEKKKVLLLAFVVALQYKQLLPYAISTAKITKIFAKQIDLEYSRPRADIVNDFNAIRDSYISKINCISLGELSWSKIG